MLKNIFGAAPTLKEQQRENDKSLRKAGRDIDRERRKLEDEEKKIEAEIKKNARTGNKDACTVLAKQLIQLRKQKTRTFAANSKIASIGFQNKNIGANVALTGAMASTAKAMGNMNKLMRPEALAADMQAFQRANARIEMTDEMINEALDDMLEDSDDEQETDKIVSQVLDEIGIEVAGKVAHIPSVDDTIGAQREKGGNKLSAPDLEAQLARLRSS